MSDQFTLLIVTFLHATKTYQIVISWQLNTYRLIE